MLDAQLDLASITVNPGVRVYRNSAWIAGLTLLPSSTSLPSGSVGVADRASSRFAANVPVLTQDTSFAGATGDLPADGTLYAAVAGDGWRLTVDGEAAPRATALGWAQSFSVSSTGSARLTFETPALYWAMLIGQVLVWILALVYLLRARVRFDEAPVLLPVPEVEPVESVPIGVAESSDRASIFDATDAPTIDDVLASITGVVPVVTVDGNGDDGVAETAPLRDPDEADRGRGSAS